MRSCVHRELEYMSYVEELIYKVVAGCGSLRETLRRRRVPSRCKDFHLYPAYVCLLSSSPHSLSAPRLSHQWQWEYSGSSAY